MDFNRETKVKDVVVSNPAATKVLEQAGVDYCCGGNSTLQHACAQAGVSAEDIMERLGAGSTESWPDDADWVSAPLSRLTEHIRGKHHRYVRDAIGRIRPLLATVKSKHGPNHPEIAEIEALFRTLSQEMVMHMQKEEQILFPYIEAVERSANGATPFEPPFFQTVRNPIQAMMREHDSAGELAKQIRVASSAYTLPADACPSFEALYRELCEFEADLHQHVHLENNILFPRSVELEAKVVSA